MYERVAHVVFAGREARRLDELQVYLGHLLELEEPVTVSVAVRIAVRFLHRKFDRQSRRDRRAAQKGGDE